MNDIITTHDGSHSVYSNKYKASYHSNFGAIEEAITVFLSAGFDAKRFSAVNNQIRILEMGFGSGLNAFLSYIHNLKYHFDVVYHSIESDPISEENWKALNYSEILGHTEIFEMMHREPWNSEIGLSDSFTLKKIHSKIEELELEAESYDIIYYDAFAPSCQSFLWTEEVHLPIYNSLKRNGILVTYCAQGKFKRMLKDIGYTIESLPGPSKKKEMTRAIKM